MLASLSPKVMQLQLQIPDAQASFPLPLGKCPVGLTSRCLFLGSRNMRESSLFSPRMAEPLELISPYLCPFIVQRPREGQRPAPSHTARKWRTESNPYSISWLGTYSKRRFWKMSPIRWMAPASSPPKGLHPHDSNVLAEGPGHCHPGIFLSSRTAPLSWVPGRADLVRTKGDSYV